MQAHYGHLSKARAQAKRLDGQTFKDRTIHAKFQIPTGRGNGPFSVTLEGLLPLLPADKVNLKSFTQASHIAFGQPSYIKHVAIDRIRDLLTGYGHLDSFDVMPLSSKATKMTAWVQFSAAEDAAPSR